VSAGTTIEMAEAWEAGPRGESVVREGRVRDERVSLRVLMAAGGTGGHIFPALAVAEELRARAMARRPPEAGCEIEFLGAGRELESRLIGGSSFPLRTIRAAGLKGVGGWRKVRNLLLLPHSALETWFLLRDFRPSVVIGTGAYLTGPAVLEAALRGIPTLLIEPNLVPGFTNRLLRPVASLAAVAFEATARYYGAKARLTGVPVRKAFARVRPKPHTPPFTILFLGGSQGSKAINDCVVSSLALLSAEAERLRIVHQTGQRDYEAVKEAYGAQGMSAEVCPFIEDVPGAFARADLVVSRSGALTVAELATAGKASLLIPFPAAADHHQLENAGALQRAGAARVIEQAALTPERLVEEIRSLLAQPEQLAQMEERARSLARPDAAERIADLIEGLVR